MGPVRHLLPLLLAAAAAAASLQYIPTDSWMYDDIERLKTAGFIVSMPSTSRPWTRGETWLLVREADSCGIVRPAGPELRAALGRLRREFGIDSARTTLASVRVPTEPDGRARADLFSRAGARREAANRYSGSVGVVLDNRPGDNFAFYERAEFTAFRPDTVDITDSAGTHVPGSRVHSWMKFATLEIEHAYLAFRIPWLRLELGRDEFFWGPGYGSSCMLSDNAPSLDHVQLAALHRNFKYLWFTSYLSRWGEKHRFLSAQRLELSLWNRLTLGGALMAVFSWDSLQTRDFFGMMNPLMPIYVTVANSGHDDNLLVGWDAALYLPKTKVYGQLLIDNYEFVERENKPCNALAWQAGVQCLPGARFEARLEYTRVNPFTYYHRIHHTMFENYGVPLGHELGPDADQWYGRLGYALSEPLSLALVASLTRRGYYNRGDFERKSYHGGQPLPEKFPAEENGEKVERTVRAGIEARLRVGCDLRVDVSAGLRTVSNAAGVPGEQQDGADLSLGFEYRY